AQLAYSAALRGRTVRCHHCGHAFPVADLLEAIVPLEPVLVGAAASSIDPPPLPRPLTPPPLPLRGARSRLEATPTENSPVAVADQPRDPEIVDEQVAENDAAIDLAPSEANERLSTAGPVAGMIGVLLFSGFVMASGIGYLLWPGSSRQTVPAI